MGIASHLVRLIVIMVFGSIWYVIYAHLNARGAVVGISWKAPDLYIPAAVYPYVFGGFLLPFIPFYWHWRGDRFARLLACYVLAIAISFLVYWIFPVRINRITYDGSGFADLLMRTLTSRDDPANCFPSSHSLFATLGFLGVWKGKPKRIVIWLTGILAAMVCLSTVLVGQHYWIDIPAGIATAFAAFIIVYSMAGLLTGKIKRGILSNMAKPPAT